MTTGLTVGSAIHDDEASIDIGSPITMLEGNSIGMTPKTVL